jgi:hypothetical protein
MHTAYICLGGLATLQVFLLLHFTYLWLRQDSGQSLAPLLVKTLAANCCVGPLAVLDGLLMVALEFKGSPLTLSLVYYLTTCSLYLLALAILNRVRWLQVLATLLCVVGNGVLAAALLMPMGGY